MPSFGQFLCETVKLYLTQHKLSSLGAINGRILLELADRAYADYQAKCKKSRSLQLEADWLDELSKDPANKGLDVLQQLNIARLWCKERGRSCTRRFFVNWIIKADRSISAHSSHAGASKPLDPYAPPPEHWRAVACRIYPEAMDWMTPHDFTKLAWTVIDLEMRRKILKGA